MWPFSIWIVAFKWQRLATWGGREGLGPVRLNRPSEALAQCPQMLPDQTAFYLWTIPQQRKVMERGPGSACIFLFLWKSFGLLRGAKLGLWVESHKGKKKTHNPTGSGDCKLIAGGCFVVSSSRTCIGLPFSGSCGQARTGSTHRLSPPVSSIQFWNKFNSGKLHVLLHFLSVLSDHTASEVVIWTVLALIQHMAAWLHIS